MPKQTTQEILHQTKVRQAADAANLSKIEQERWARFFGREGLRRYLTNSKPLCYKPFANLPEILFLQKE